MPFIVSYIKIACTHPYYSKTLNKFIFHSVPYNDQKKVIYFCRDLNIAFAFPGKRAPARNSEDGTPFPSSNLIS